MYKKYLITNENGECYVKVTPQSKRDTLGQFTFILTKEFSTKPLYVRTLKFFTISKLIKKLYYNGSFCYSDNLTGTEFNNILKEWDIF